MQSMESDDTIRETPGIYTRLWIGKNQFCTMQIKERDRSLYVCPLQMVDCTIVPYTSYSKMNMPIPRPKYYRGGSNTSGQDVHFNLRNHQNVESMSPLPRYNKHYETSKILNMHPPVNQSMGAAHFSSNIYQMPQHPEASHSYIPSGMNTYNNYSNMLPKPRPLAEAPNMRHYSTLLQTTHSPSTLTKEKSNLFSEVSSNSSMSRQVFNSGMVTEGSNSFIPESKMSTAVRNPIPPMKAPKQSSFPVVGESPLERTHYFCGTIERVLKWHKICKNDLCYYEVVASVVSLQEGSVKLQKIMLLRDNKGPILQVQYYASTHMDIEDFHIGQKLRCVGRMVGVNIMHAVRIKTATEEDISYLQRHCYISDHAISNTLKVVNNF